MIPISVLEGAPRESKVCFFHVFMTDSGLVDDSGFQTVTPQRAFRFFPTVAFGLSVGCGFFRLVDDSHVILAIESTARLQNPLLSL